MDNQSPKSLIEHFSTIDDPRIDRTKRHKLIDILVIGICATICGAETWEDFELFGHAKHDWFKSFLELPNSIPSHDTFRRVFARIDPQQFQQAFLDRVRSVTRLTQAEVVAIDGKQLRRSQDKAAGKTAINMVSAWAEQNRLVLGQVRVVEKSNEITAIPELLRMLEISGCIVTIDAMGCQTEIASQIKAKQADYVLAVKGNQGNLLEDLASYFDWALKDRFNETSYRLDETVDGGHGRIEVRRCYASEDIEWLRNKGQWKAIRSIVMVESERSVGGGEASLERRYYISSLEADAKELNRVIRSHWSIENSLHWVLDIAFREDDSRIRKGHGPENMATLRHKALNLLKQDKSIKVGIKSKRKNAGWNERYLLKVLNG
ncbi:MAG TPA: ISAs1 family transposase [Blastocatellia bacterium]|nr:ISAs1 family transposase [Blastocatellia bacterium]